MAPTTPLHSLELDEIDSEAREVMHESRSHPRFIDESREMLLEEPIPSARSSPSRRYEQISFISTIAEMFGVIFYNLGRFCYKSPIAFIIIDLLLVGFLVNGLKHVRVENAMEKLFSADNSASLTHQVWAAKHMPQLILKKKLAIAFASTTSNNVLTIHNFELLFDYWELLSTNTSYYTGPSYAWGWRHLHFKDVCEYDFYLKRCKFQHGLLRFFNYNRTYFHNRVSNQEELLDVLNAGVYADGTTVPTDLLFGKPVYDENGRIVSAQSIGEALFVSTLRYDPRVPLHDTSEEPYPGVPPTMIWKQSRWQKAWLREALSDTRKFNEGVKDVNIYYIVPEFLGETITESMAVEAKLLIFCFITIGVVSMFFLSPAIRPSELRLGMAIVGLFVALASIAAGFGLVAYCGVKANYMICMLPFILIGIAVDDDFVLAKEFDNLKHIKNLEHRMALTMRRAGPAILTTTLTDMVAFGLGVWAPLGSVRSFCLHSVATVGVDFILQVTLWFTIFGINARREQAGTPDCCCCLIVLPYYRRKRRRNAINLQPDDDDEAISDGGLLALSPEKQQKKEQHRRTRYLVRLQVNRWSVIFGIVWCVVSTIVCSVAVYLLESDFTISDFLYDGSEFQRSAIFMNENHPVLMWDIYFVFHGMEVSAVNVQRQIMSLQDQLSHDSAVAGSPMIFLPEYINWYRDPENNLELTKDGYIHGLKWQMYLKEFLKSRPGFYGGLFVNPPPNPITNIRAFSGRLFYSNCRNLYTMATKMEHIQKIFAESSLNAGRPIEDFRVFHVNFAGVIFEMILGLKNLLLYNFVCMTFAILIVLFIMLQDILVTLCVTISVAHAQIMILGTFYFIGYLVEPGDTFILVMGSGMIADYSSHVAQRFIHEYQMCPDFQTALFRTYQVVLPAVVGAGGSSLMGAIPALFAKTKFFRKFGIVIILLSSYGLTSAIFLLPLLLYLLTVYRKKRSIRSPVVSQNARTRSNILSPLISHSELMDAQRIEDEESSQDYVQLQTPQLDSVPTEPRFPSPEPPRELAMSLTESSADYVQLDTPQMDSIPKEPRFPSPEPQEVTVNVTGGEEKENIVRGLGS